MMMTCNIFDCFSVPIDSGEFWQFWVVSGHLPELPEIPRKNTACTIMHGIAPERNLLFIGQYLVSIQAVFRESLGKLPGIVTNLGVHLAPKASRNTAWINNSLPDDCLFTGKSLPDEQQMPPDALLKRPTNGTVFSKCSVMKENYLNTDLHKSTGMQKYINLSRMGISCHAPVYI